MPTLVLTDPVNDTLTDANIIANNNTAIKNIVNGGITNDNISGSAAIAYAKLNLTTGILNGDINSAANIAVSKLAPGTNGQALITSAGVAAWGSGGGLVPTGTVVPYAGASAPTDWLLCDGTAVSQVTYAALYAIVGVTYGNPGGGNFNLPNLKGKMPVGLDAAQTEFDAIAESGGAKTHTLVIGEIPAHTHTQQGTPFDDAGNEIHGFSSAFTSFYINTGSAGGGGSHNNLQPYLVMNYIIKT